MNRDMRRFAPLGLYLFLAALLAAGGLYVVQRQWNLPVQISLGVAVLGLALFVLLDPDRVRVLLTGRQARYGSNALVLSLAFFGILIVANYLVYTNNKQWDLTEDKQFTLAPETIETLKTLPEPVKARAFFTSRTSPDTARNLLEQYELNSEGKFSYEFIDPEQNPVVAEDANVTRDGMIVMEMGERQQPAESATEQAITASMVRLLNPESSVVYFLTGHGEFNPEDTGEQSFAQVKRTLESKNYTVKLLNLLAENAIPEDAKVIIVAGPRKPISEGEVQQLEQYLNNGGALIVMEEPLPLTEFGDAPDPLADSLSTNWGITLGKDIIVDPTSQQPFVPYAASYDRHMITEQLARRQMTTLFPTARSVRIENPPEGASPAAIASTSAQSWAETDLAALASEDQAQQVAFNEGQDMAGPVALAVVAENFTTNARLLVVGDAEFATDAFYFQYGNGDLIVNAIDWSAGQEDIINLTPKQNTQRMLIPPQQTAMNLILLGSVFIVPGLVLAAGIAVFIQRRKRG